MKRIQFILIALVYLGIMSCDEQADLQVDQGFGFYPLAVGQTRTYRVEEIKIIGSVSDTSNYYLREVIKDSISNNQITYLIYRYVTEDTTTAWSLDSVWTTRRTDIMAVVTENNIPYVKLTFPVKEGISWDGNVLNTQEENTYYYDLSGSIEVDGELIEAKDVIQVVIADVPANLVEQDERSEVYVRGIGLVQKRYISGAFCQPESGCNEVGVFDNGRLLNQYLIGYEL